MRVWSSALCRAVSFAEEVSELIYIHLDIYDVGVVPRTLLGSIRNPHLGFNSNY